VQLTQEELEAGMKFTLENEGRSRKKSKQIQKTKKSKKKRYCKEQSIQKNPTPPETRAREINGPIPPMANHVLDLIYEPTDP